MSSLVTLWLGGLLLWLGWAWRIYHTLSCLADLEQQWPVPNEEEVTEGGSQTNS